MESTISLLIGAAESGDCVAADTLFSTLYSELRRMAKRELARKGSPTSLSVTTLLHEAYLDMAAYTDIFAGTAQLDAAEVVMTVFDGQVVFKKPS